MQRKKKLSSAMDFITTIAPKIELPRETKRRRKTETAPKTHLAN